MFHTPRKLSPTASSPASPDTIVIMRKITSDLFQQILDQSSIKPRVKREVRFVSSVAGMDDSLWQQTEFIPISDRSGNKGVLIIEFDNKLYATSYEISRGITSQTGKAQPIICDFCKTWQTGSRSGSITLQRPGRDTGSIAFLCCADLLCSQHVRNLTSAAKTSRSQLREDLSNEQRVARLSRRLEEVCGLLGLSPLDV